ncbi:MAG: DNA primase [Tannerella sp.]|jgi:DNA primase|nr:DNA primase [Tannerella sp.]
MIDQITKEKILDAANIYEVVSDFVALKRRGVNWVGLCPFHADKTPSFYVSPAKNLCKCFACGEGGTPALFIMKHEKISFPDALRYLAKKYHIEIQEHELTDTEKQLQSDRESMFILNAWAQKHFTSRLWEHDEGRTIGLSYFRERKFRDDIIRKFQLGYSLEKRDDLLVTALKNGYKKEYLEKTGLVTFSADNAENDRFRGRVIFPIHSLSGKVVGFGGRILKKNEKTAKYVNSPESDIYHKSNELYGIYFARQAIAQAGNCYLVEGYTDVISMHQSGIENVVASSGTSLTQGQIRMIARFTKNITVLYDGDSAGIKAAIRGIDMLLEEGMNVKVVLLPEGEDPDSFAHGRNAHDFNQFIKDNETDFIRFKTNLLLKDAGDDPIKRASLVKDIIVSVSVIPDEITRTLYVSECSNLLEINEQILHDALNKIRDAKKEAEFKAKQNTSSSAERTENQSPETLKPLLPEQEAVFAVKRNNKTVSPYIAFEEELLRYIVHYGERVLYDYEEDGRRIIVKVAEFIRSELAVDELTFQTPVYKTMLEEAAEHCTEDDFKAFAYFTSHSDPEVVHTAAVRMVDNAYIVHFEPETSGDKLAEKDEEELKQKRKHELESLRQSVCNELLGLKNAYIRQEIAITNKEIRELEKTGDMTEIIKRMEKLKKLNETKIELNKQLGERIIL